ncbi:hypothetical protein [Desulfuribacillus alkaliarsenatis]|uniref:LamG domain-containing protein n=1 Tax=Desulfuribacillus alkaliarsenatis TaxID=766136 RepID=A0A1E5G2S1_9FIRM|nr:hypothetical protein [Desulfuribacillus alkaliarsenatis]OEF97366.1 hypothetical protein BHF68_03920 [Desulfuribacillus alkaliarsenatis]
MYTQKTLIMLVIGLSLALLVLACVGWLLELRAIPEPVVYFSDEFQSLDNWTVIDTTWLTEFSERQGVAALSRHLYVAPNIHRDIQLEESPPDNVVWHFSTRIDSFTEEAFTLGGIYFPTESVVIVMDRKGKIGVAGNIFEIPKYTSTRRHVISKEKWHEVYVHINNSDKAINIYLDNAIVYRGEWNSPSYPVKELRLGTVWLKGAGEYGAPTSVYYDQVSIANEGILPRPTLASYIRSLLNG